MKALGLDPAEALEIYKNEAVQPPSVEEAKERKGSLFSLKYASIGLVLILLIPALFLLKPSEKKEGFNLAKKPSFKKVKEASPGNEILNIIKPSVKTAEADYKNRHLLRVAAVEESWIMIRIDDDITYSMVLRPGEVKTWSAERGFYLKTGNAGGIEVSFDEIEIGSPGKRGAVVSLKLPEDLKKYKKTIN
ncbi:MAG: DUF4115 domain-containing protein [Nitrospirae bacterium]|nr:MAG: DUF4115 domain-containing protein [Nitrospirota bacterium]